MSFAQLLPGPCARRVRLSLLTASLAGAIPPLKKNPHKRDLVIYFIIFFLFKSLPSTPPQKQAKAAAGLGRVIFPFATGLSGNLVIYGRGLEGVFAMGDISCAPFEGRAAQIATFAAGFVPREPHLKEK